MPRITLGSVVRDTRKPSEITKEAPKKDDYIKLAPGVSLSYNGKPLDVKFINLSDPHKLPDILEEMGKVTAEVADDMRTNAQKIPFVRYNLVVNTRN